MHRISWIHRSQRVHTNESTTRHRYRSPTGAICQTRKDQSIYASPGRKFYLSIEEETCPLPFPPVFPCLPSPSPRGPSFLCRSPTEPQAVLSGMTVNRAWGLFGLIPICRCGPGTAWVCYPRGPLLPCKVVPPAVSPRPSLQASGSIRLPLQSADAQRTSYWAGSHRDPVTLPRSGPRAQGYGHARTPRVFVLLFLTGAHERQSGEVKGEGTISLYPRNVAGIAALQAGISSSFLGTVPFPRPPTTQTRREVAGTATAGSGKGRASHETRKNCQEQR